MLHSVHAFHLPRPQVRQFYTAPTLLRSLLQLGDAFPRQANLASLRVLASAGEPMNEHAWHWFHEVGGRDVGTDGGCGMCVGTRKAARVTGLCILRPCACLLTCANISLAHPSVTRPSCPPLGPAGCRQLPLPCG